MRAIKVIIPASQEVVTVTELARNLRLIVGDGEYSGDEADELQRFITTAREDVERYTQRYYTLQHLCLTVDRFKPSVRLHIDAMAIIDVIYHDKSNTELQLDGKGYYLIRSGHIMFDLKPDVYKRPDAVNITFSVGTDYVPTTVKQAIILLASHFYENREATSPLTIKNVPFSYTWLLDAFKIPVVA